MRQSKPCFDLNGAIFAQITKLIIVISTILISTSLVYAKDIKKFPSPSLIAKSKYQPVNCVRQSETVSSCDCDHEPSILHEAACRIVLNANCLFSVYGKNWECFHPPADQGKRQKVDDLAAVVDKQEVHCTEFNDSIAVCDCDHERSAIHAAACKIVLDANCKYQPNDDVWTCPIDPR